jgi:long-subunit fatty acid transport protein
MKKSLIVIVLMLLVNSAIQAQRYFEPVAEDEVPQKKVFFGGNFGGGFSSDAIYFTVSPLIGYRVAPKLSIGGGVIYQYISQEYRPVNQPTVRLDSHNYGFRAFTNYRVTSLIYATAEYENQSVELLTSSSETIREWVPGFMIGLGAYQPIGSSNKSIGVSFLYNLLHDDFKSPYSSAFIFRFGIIM